MVSGDLRSSRRFKKGLKGFDEFLKRFEDFSEVLHGFPGFPADLQRPKGCCKDFNGFPWF